MTRTVDAAPCPVCGGADPAAFLHRPSVAVHQNLLLGDERSARGIARGRLDMRCCGRCDFVFNAAFDPSLLEYGQAYDNAQHCSPVFARHVDGLVDHLVRERGVRDCRVVEVGCGQGTFLRKLVEAPGAGNTGVGFDPAAPARGPEAGGRLRFEHRFYDEQAADLPADVVVCRHVIEHVPDPPGLLRSVRRALARSPRARVYFETPCARWILANLVIWDLFYEHCSIFTGGSLRHAFETAGFAVTEIRHVFGGQYLWLEATVAPAAAASREPETSGLPALARAFAAAEVDRVRTWREQVERWSGAGPVVLWGAGAKGVTFANLVDADRRLLECVVDVNPAKQQRYLPGTGHPIVAPARLAEVRPAVALVLNPNYRAEIEAMLAALSVPARVIDLMSATTIADEADHRHG